MRMIEMIDETKGWVVHELLTPAWPTMRGLADVNDVGRLGLSSITWLE